MLTIALISKDDQLQRLCRQIFSERLRTPWALEFPASAGSAGDSQLIIWDLHPDAYDPDCPGNTVYQVHLCLVDRHNIGAFCTRSLSAQTRILLKPVTYVTLSAVLEDCLAAIRDTGVVSEAPADMLRTDRDEILQSLIRANLRLQEYDQDRTAFLTRAIHDFRAPLTALLGYCGLILDGQFGTIRDDQRDVLERMLHNAKRLSRMASAMFDLGIGREADDGPVVLRPGDIRGCIEQAQQELAYLIADKSLAVSVHVSPPAGELLFDTEKLLQVLVNLLDNACRFTRKGGSVEISGYPFFWERRTSPTARLATERRQFEIRAPNAFRVNIQDSGPGIPAQHIANIFGESTSYYGGKDRSGGGLGLAICRLLIGQHGGHIWAESSDSGAIFSFLLPLKSNAGQGAKGADDK